jgi:hypothetical protein
MTKTVSVELTENQLRATLEAYRRWEREWKSLIIPDDDANAAIAVLQDARRQFDINQKVKVEVLQAASDLCTSSECIMNRLNAAGWDLVRMEEAE